MVEAIDDMLSVDMDRCNDKWATSESSETTGEIKGPARGVAVTRGGPLII